MIILPRQARDKHTFLNKTVLCVQGGQMHTTANDVMATQLRLYSKTALHDANAYLYMRHDWGGFENNTIRDQVPHFLLSFWYHSVNTGDKQLVKDCWPAIEKVVGYLLHDMQMEADGIPTVPGVSGLPHGYDSPVCTDPNQKICPSNWCDASQSAFALPVCVSRACLVK